MTDVIIAVVAIAFALLGLSRPYVAFAGYIWTDLVGPQHIVSGFMSGIPISMIMAGVCFISIFINLGKLKRPQTISIPLLLMVFIVWISYTTYASAFPMQAWIKWDVAIKTMIMSFLMFFVVTNKKQLEFLILIFLFSVGFFIISAGLKTLASGGGYGARLVVGTSNSGISESSTLAFYSVFCIPLIIFIKNNSILFPEIRRYKIAWIGVMLLVIATVVGTYARTGLIALFVYVFILFMKSEKKIKLTLLISLTAIVLVMFSPSSWKVRMDTMSDINNEGSAMARVAVWRWTVDYVKDNPGGGGFNSYIANDGILNNYLGSSDIYVTGMKAFHSIYFEVLGEHGYFGLFVFLALLYKVWSLNRMVVDNSSNIISWNKSCAVSLTHCLIIFSIAGAFIGIAFQPILYQLIAFTVSLEKVTSDELRREK